MTGRHGAPDLRIAMIGAGVMARAHSTALHTLAVLRPDLPLRPRLVAVADVNEGLAADLAARFGWERATGDWRSIVNDDVDLVVACLPPAHNREVVLAAAAAGRHVVSEKPLAVTADAAAELLVAVRRAGVFHGLGAGYRWSPALRAIRALIDQGELGEVRSLRASFLLDYGADPDVPLTWRFRRELAGGGIAIDTGYHLVDIARFLAGEIVAVQSLERTFIAERPIPGADAIGNRGEGGAAPNAVIRTGPVDVEDAIAGLLTFAGGAYGVLETSRMTIGRRVSLQVEIFGSRGSADWDLERPDEFRICLPGDLATFGYRRIMVNPSHPGAAHLLVAGADGTGIGWLGFEVSMWAEFLTAIAEGRPVHADFADGVADNAVIDALYAAARSGTRTPVVIPTSLAPSPIGGA
jgi:predicted dehydrogenase